MKNLERFKKRLMKKHLLESLTVGASSALVAASVGLTISYLTNPSVSLFASLASGLTVGLVAGYYYFKKKKPTELDVARMLDKQFELKEKVLTMVTLQDEEGVFVECQRKDAMKEVEKQNEKLLIVRLSSWALPTLIVAALLFGSSFFTPKKALRARTPEVTDPSVVVVDDSDSVGLIEEPDLSSEPDSEKKTTENDFDNDLDGLKKDIQEGDWDGVLDDLEKIALDLDDLDPSEAQEAVKKLIETIEEELEKGTPLTDEQEEALRDLVEKLKDGPSDPGQVIKDWLDSEPGEPTPAPVPSPEDPSSEPKPEDSEGKGTVGNQTGKHSDTIYTDDGEIEYHEIIDQTSGEATDDAKKVGDDETVEITGDYFEGLYEDITEGGK